MFRTVATTLLALSASANAVALAQAAVEASAAEQAQDMKATDSISAQEQQARQRAVQVLASQLKIANGDVAVVQVEPHTWPDSSMGCGRPGTAALTVITDGYIVSLSAQKRQYRVHVAGATAIICDKPQFTRKELRRPASARGLDVMIEQAREDLALRLGTQASQVRLLRTLSRQWPDSSLDCAQPDEAITPGPVAGYRILLQYASRTYTYHTNLKNVRPCPGIEER
jgi:hypothetical protein